MLIEMKVTGLTIDPFTNMPIIVLKDLEEKNALPIWIGLIEASAIATELENIQTPRPLTHDLMKNAMEGLEAQLVKVAVVDVRDNTFYANIFITRGDKEWVLDSRPSDAIALALRSRVPVYVEKEVIEKSRRMEVHSDMADDEKKDKWTEILEGLSPEDFGKYKM